jgi:hypothetical protein
MYFAFLCVPLTRPLRYSLEGERTVQPKDDATTPSEYAARVREALARGSVEREPLKLSRPVSLANYAHLIYLGILPPLATFWLLYTYGFPAPLLLFIAGTVAVGTYLGATFYYTPQQNSLWMGIIVLIDGPAWALASLYSSSIVPVGFAIEGLIVDGAAIWLSILVLAMTSRLPTRSQRWGSVGYMLVALGATTWMVWPYLRAHLWGHWFSIAILCAGIAEASAIRFKQVKRDDAKRNSNAAAVYIVVLLLLWVAAVIAGNVLHEFKR